MAGREESSRLATPVVYCVVPRDLAPSLHELLRRHFRGDASVKVVVELRVGERRQAADRRTAQVADGSADRRLIRGVLGRRVGDRRALALEVPPRELPRRVRRFAHRLVFVERLEPSRLEAEDLDSARLVTAFQAGDRHAFALLYARYFDRVYSFLRFALRSRDEAEDVTQQVFLKTLEALPRYERRAQPFRAWLFTIARNHLRKELLRGARAQQRVELAASALDDGSEEDNAVSAQLRALSWISDPELQMFIERLPLAQRQVLFLRYALDLSHEQTAAVLGRGVLDVRQMQSRALRMLRARLAAVGRGSPHRARPGMVRRRDKSHVLRSRRFALMP